MTVNEKYLFMSYELSYYISENKKSITIGEDLVLPAIKMVEIPHFHVVFLPF